MQFKKVEIEKKIIEIAKKEFLKKGFEKVSMREIASKSEITVGNIYRYFKNKEDVFYKIVKPAMEVIENHLDTKYVNIKTQGTCIFEIASLESIKEAIIKLFLIIEEYNDEFKLLFFCAGNSKYKDYKHVIRKYYINFINEYFRILKEHHIKIKEDLSQPLVHAFSGFYVSTIEEIIINVSDIKTKDLFIKQLSISFHYGFMGLFEQFK